MTTGKGIAVAGMWTGAGIAAFGSPAASMMIAILAFIMTVGALAQEQEN